MMGGIEKLDFKGAIELRNMVRRFADVLK